jgi:hypothetical protein
MLVSQEQEKVEVPHVKTLFSQTISLPSVKSYVGEEVDVALSLRPFRKIILGSSFVGEVEHSSSGSSNESNFSSYLDLQYFYLSVVQMR